MKRINIRRSLISFVLVLLLVMGGVTGCITITTPQAPATPPTTTAPAPTPAPTPSPINPDWTPPATANQSPVLPSIADAVALVKPSVVSIDTETTILSFFGPATQQGAGSGWILDKDGNIVTNYHVVEGAKTITVTLDDGRTFTADPNSVSFDSLNDIAIIKIDTQNLPALKMGDSTKLRVGDWVVAIGNSLGQGIRATEGIVSREGVSLPVDQSETLYDLIETSAAINPGNSGGPLVNLSGEVIGITSAKIADVGVEGMGYAISMETAIPIIQELINRGYVARPWLGVELYTVNQLAVRQLKLAVDKGVLLTKVSADSPAAQAGLTEGDVIVSIGGKDVASVQELTRILYSSKIGQPLDVVYWRGASKNTTQVIPAESPPPP
jgi:serine protease Do